ncbi:MAG: hypothetical protein Q4C04_03250 [Clostridia bacterium]|nr:hypothetical protein [Clostridia bacterium]
MDYRSRSIRNSEEQKGGGRAIAFIVVSVAMILFIVFTTVGKSCASGLWGAIFGKSKDEENQEIIDNLSEQEANLSTPDLYSGQVTVPARNFYLLQMGQYSDSETAATQAYTIQTMGAGGYVYYDGMLYRVMAAAYPDENSLSKVQDQVRSAGYSNSAYILSTDALTITVEGEEDRVEEVSEVIAVAMELPNKLYDCYISYDKGELDNASLQDEVRTLYRELTGAYGQIMTETSESVKYIAQFLSDNMSLLSTFLELDATIDQTVLSSEIKRLHLQTIVRFSDFIDGIDTESE